MPQIPSLHQMIVSLLTTSVSSYRGKSKYQVIQNLQYSNSQSERQQGDVYIPEGNGTFPGVILVHGGGWQHRSRQDMNGVAQSLASHGFVVFNINYRFCPEHKHPAPIDDLEAAMKFIKAKREEYKLDEKRIGLWGYSSGGHTVSYYALTRAKNLDLKVHAVVTGGAPYDFTWYSHSPYIKNYLGEFRDSILDQYVDASATSHISSEAPPFFIYHAEKDRLVEYAQALAFEAKLKLNQIPVKSCGVPFWGHGTTFAISDRPVKQGISFLLENLQLAS